MVFSRPHRQSLSVGLLQRPQVSTFVSKSSGDFHVKPPRPRSAGRLFSDSQTGYTVVSGESATPSGGKTSGMSRRATPIRLSAIP